ncbi:MAG: prepilin peptidase [Planctomycetaceae bacterium]|nr:prepilin peptidase [Planctomycetaceae bacterium]
MLIVVALVGLILGRIAAGWASVVLEGMNSGGLLACPACGNNVSRFQRWCSPLAVRCSCGNRPVRWHQASAVCLSLLFVVFAWTLLPPLDAQNITEVRPSSMPATRLPFHLLLIFLLWVATLTDLLDYVIPDEVTMGGSVLAVILATLSGELQMVHIWVNWDLAIEGIRGPWLPEWMDHHRHLHGFAWSITGLLTGGSLTWLLRWLSGRILGQPSLGLGDVTLMMLIGAFLGWQSTLCVLAMAPMTGAVIGLSSMLLRGKGFVAYGPYLACSAFLVMCLWRWLWADFLTLRDIFSHWPSVLSLVGCSFGLLCVLLFGLRIFRSLPAEAVRRR